MSGRRFNLDLFITETTFQSIPAAKKQAFVDAVRAIKAYATKINAGAANEELSIKAVWHRCYHDETPPGPCGAEQEI